MLYKFSICYIIYNTIQKKYFKKNKNEKKKKEGEWKSYGRCAQVGGGGRYVEHDGPCHFWHDDRVKSQPLITHSKNI